MGLVGRLSRRGVCTREFNLLVVVSSAFQAQTDGFVCVTVNTTIYYTTRSPQQRPTIRQPELAANCEKRATNHKFSLNPVHSNYRRVQVPHVRRKKKILFLIHYLLKGKPGQVRIINSRYAYHHHNRDILYIEFEP